MYNYCNAIIILPYRTIPPYHCVLLTWQLYCYVTQQGRSKTSIIRCKWIYLLYFQVWYSVLTCTNTGIKYIYIYIYILQIVQQCTCTAIALTVLFITYSLCIRKVVDDRRNKQKALCPLCKSPITKRYCNSVYYIIIWPDYIIIFFRLNCLKSGDDYCIVTIFELSLFEE